MPLSGWAGRRRGCADTGAAPPAAPSLPVGARPGNYANPARRHNPGGSRGAAAQMPAAGQSQPGLPETRTQSSPSRWQAWRDLNSSHTVPSTSDCLPAGKAEIRCIILFISRVNIVFLPGSFMETEKPTDKRGEGGLQCTVCPQPGCSRGQLGFSVHREGAGRAPGALTPLTGRRPPGRLCNIDPRGALPRSFGVLLLLLLF